MTKRAAHPSITALLIILSVMVSLAGCAPHADRDRLRRAEALMESDAKAASAALDSIRPTTLRGEARARYALLRTQADYKNYVPLTTDSLILIATRHYGTRRKTLPAALSQYYLGCTYKDMGRDLDAIDALLRATILFPDSLSKYSSNSHFELGLLYLSHSMAPQAVSELNSYLEYGHHKSDSTIIGYANYFLGKAHLVLNDNEKANQYFQNVVGNKWINTSYKSDALFQLAKSYLYVQNDDAKSEEYINKYFSVVSDDTQNGAAFTVKGDIYKRRQEYDSAFIYYEKSLQCKPELNTYCWAYKGLAELSPILQLNDSASDYINNYTVLLDSVYKVTHRSEINELITNHTIELHDREMAERHNRLLWMLGFCALCVVAGAAISVLAIKKRQQEKYTARINGLQDKVRQLSNDLAQAMESRSDMAADDEPADDVLLLSATVAEGDSLFLQLIDSSVKLYVERNRRMHEALMNYNPSLDMDMETRRQVISTLDLSFAELTSTLLLYYPTLKREEVRTAVCSLLGYRPKLTSELFSVTLSGLRSRKQRLKSKLPEQIFTLFYPQQEENCPSGDSDNQ